LFVSPFVLAEIRELYEKLPAKYGITAADTDDLARNVVSFATTIFDIPEVYRHPIDPDDSLYVNLALCASARLIVSRDRHLLNLMDQSRREGQDFRGHFPAMRILDPVELLRELDEQSAQEVN
jgi:predicted nucleic acid-binding protein